jgi:oxalate decarboxylase
MMNNILRRGLVGSLMAGAAGLAAALPAVRASAETQDGHAAGQDAAPFAGGVPVLNRRAGDAPAFTASLDQATIKATSGGWAREITARQLPIASNVAIAHLFLNPGGAREMHWHNAAEWAYVMAGRAQATVVNPDGAAEVFNVGPGDLWYFPAGYPHAIQTIGAEPCHALLAFDDGLYGEHGTFGISDLMSRFSPLMLEQCLGVDASDLDDLPHGETYIMQGDILRADSVEAAADRPLTAAQSRRFGLRAARAETEGPGGTIRIATVEVFPAATAMSGLLLRLAPGAMQALHWHTGTDEMHYVMNGRARFTMYGPDKHLAVAEIAAGACAYIPRNAAHVVENTGPGEVEILAIHNSGRPSTVVLSDCMAAAPRHLLANNLGCGMGHVPAFHSGRSIAAAAG